MRKVRQVLFSSDSSTWSRHAFHFLDGIFDLVDWYPWDHGTPHTRSFDGWAGCDLLLSFKADLIIPDRMLSRVRGHAVNIHPSVPEYRGIGGYRYTLDDGREEFGSTCHFLTRRVDAGPIIEVSRFRTCPGETEESLRDRTAAVALEQLYRVATAVSEGRELVPDDRERWGERLYTRADLAAYRGARLTGAGVPK
jgi:phosphoribosylglycinamide formyltransferase-1